jgi:hypothetical protein
VRIALATTAGVGAKHRLKFGHSPGNHQSQRGTSIFKRLPRPWLFLRCATQSSFLFERGRPWWSCCRRGTALRNGGLITVHPTRLLQTTSADGRQRPGSSWSLARNKRCNKTVQPLSREGSWLQSSGSSLTAVEQQKRWKTAARATSKHMSSALRHQYICIWP